MLRHRKPFDRARPEDVGIPSRLVLNYLDKLECCGTQMHGLMIMRHDELITEAFWTPFGPNIRHGLQSHSKTYAGTAIGIAYTKGILKLDERIVDIFPEEVPEEIDENLNSLMIRDLLTMSCGMKQTPVASDHWIRDFLHTPVVDKPGSVFMYNSYASNLLGAIIRKKTGQSLHEFLKNHLFEKIGIDADNLKWMILPDGSEFCAGGLYATLEDNFRLLKLYADGGVWEGERILAEDFVKMATSSQIDTSSGNEDLDHADNAKGYGFQLWMCQLHNAYRADGFLGEFTIVLPDLDMIIGITETAMGQHVAQKVLNITWDFADKISSGKDIDQDDDAYELLAARLKTLNIGNPVCQPFSRIIDQINGREYELQSGTWTPFEGNFMTGEKSDNILSFRFDFDEYGFIWSFETQSGRKEKIRFASNGTRFTNLIGKQDDLTRLYLGDAYFADDETLIMNGRFVETCIEDSYRLTFNDKKITIVKLNQAGPFFGKPELIEAKQK
ncbi:MAG: serine hydrolase [Erysipelotrichaceae bacterium]|nr:serine hydrolase [Erysipelotrichaceae bacterium]